MRSLLLALGLLLAVVAAGLGVSGVCGGLDPRLDIASQLAPLAILSGFATLPVAFAALGRRRLAVLALGLVGVLSASALMAPEWVRSTGPTAPANAPGQIKIVEFNVWKGNQHLPAVADWLAAQHPDVVILEESGPRLRDLITAQTGWKGVMGYASSTMIITPGPYLTMDRPKVPWSAQLTFVNATYAGADGETFEVIATHLGWPGERQARQRAALRDVVTHFAPDRTILAGDFNSAPWSFARRQDDRELGLIRRDRAMWSWPADIGGAGGFHAPFPVLPIDHLYAGPGWATVSVARGPHLGSDHYPLIVTLAPVRRDALYPGSPGR